MLRGYLNSRLALPPASKTTIHNQFRARPLALRKAAPAGAAATGHQSTPFSSVHEPTNSAESTRVVLQRPALHLLELSPKSKAPDLWPLPAPSSRSVLQSASPAASFDPAPSLTPPALQSTPTKWSSWLHSPVLQPTSVALHLQQDKTRNLSQRIAALEEAAPASSPLPSAVPLPLILQPLSRPSRAERLID
jgi:hypothetical protein